MNWCIGPLYVANHSALGLLQRKMERWNQYLSSLSERSHWSKRDSFLIHHLLTPSQMRLSAVETSEIKPGLVAALSQIGVRTAADLLFASPTEGAASIATSEDSLQAVFRRLPPGTCTFGELNAIARAAIAQGAAPAVTGRQLLVARSARDHDGSPGISSGIAQLDVLLGGLVESHVVEVVGDSGSGKTVRVSPHKWSICFLTP
jgi:hypothetical protein